MSSCERCLEAVPSGAARRLPLGVSAALGLFLSVLLGACTMVGGGARPAVEPAPASLPERETDARTVRAPARASTEGGHAPDRLAAGVVDVALESIGTPYRWGGSGVNGFDCSGLIQFAYGRFGIRLPRVSTDQIRSGSPVDPVPSRLRPGDILGFSETQGGDTSHVGLYIGGSEFIHSGSDGVTVSTLRSPYWQRHLVAARRIVE